MSFPAATAPALVIETAANEAEAAQLVINPSEDLADVRVDGRIEGLPDDALDEMIGRLPANYRVVLNLFVFEQLSHREISQRLGISEQNSAIHFYRAKKALQKMIKDYLNKRQRI